MLVKSPERREDEGLLWIGDGLNPVKTCEGHRIFLIPFSQALYRAPVQVPLKWFHYCWHFSFRQPPFQWQSLRDSKLSPHTRFTVQYDQETYSILQKCRICIYKCKVFISRALEDDTWAVRSHLVLTKQNIYYDSSPPAVSLESLWCLNSSVSVSRSSRYMNLSISLRQLLAFGYRASNPASWIFFQRSHTFFYHCMRIDKFIPMLGGSIVSICTTTILVYTRSSVY